MTELEFENLKGFRERVTIPVRPVTLLFGPNSAGKSTVLQGLNLLHSILHEFSFNPSSTRLGEGAMDLGGFKRLVHGQDLNRQIELGITIDLEQDDLLDCEAAQAWSELSERFEDAGSESDLFDLGEFTAGIESVGCSVLLGWSDTLRRPLVRRTRIRFNGDVLFTLTCSNDGVRKELIGINVKHPLLGENRDSNWLGALTRTVRSQYGDLQTGTVHIELVTARDALPDWKRNIRFADVFDDGDRPGIATEDRTGEELAFGEEVRAAKASLALLLAGPVELIARYLDRSRYVGPLRQVPARAHQSREDSPSWANGLAAWDRVVHRKALREEVNRWLNVHKHDGQERGLRSGYIVDVARYREVDEAGDLWAALRSSDPSSHKGLIKKQLDESPEGERLTLFDVSRNLAVTPHEVGVGVSEVVPVIVGSLDASIPLLSVEQPELHIHPRMQVSLGDLFLAATSDGGKTLLLETHSEHLILRLLRRVREGGADAKSISVVYINKRNDVSVVERLPVTSDGDFAVDWPGGFFDERTSELLF
ncbi:MAG: AAA family ATPase [Panacagrimonas sp.]